MLTLALVAAFGTLPIAPVHATRTNTLIAQKSGQFYWNSGPSNTLGPWTATLATFGASYLGVTLAGKYDLVVFQVTTAAGTIWTLPTDNSGNGTNVWHQAQQQLVSAGTGVSGKFPASEQVSVFWCYCEFASDPTVTLSATYSSGYVLASGLTGYLYIQTAYQGYLFDSNFQTLYQYTVAGQSAGYFSGTGYVPYPATTSGYPQNLMGILVPNPSLMIVAGFGTGTSISAATFAVQGYTVTSSNEIGGPLGTGQSSGCVTTASGSASTGCALWGEGYQFEYFAGSASIQAYCSPTCASLYPYVWGLAAWVFVGTGYVSPNPTCNQANGACQQTGGTGNAISSHRELVGNQTYLYTGTTPAIEGLMITNITIKVASVSWTSGTLHHIWVGLYQVQKPCPPFPHTCGGTMQGNTNAVNPGNPMTRIPTGYQVWTVGDSATSYYLHFYPITTGILNGTTWAIAFGTDHNGANLYLAASGNMFNDTADGYFPATITSGVATAHPFFMQFQFYMPSVSISITTTTTTNGSGGNGGYLNLGGNFIILLILMLTVPLLFMTIIGSTTKSGMGVLGGLMMGLTVSAVIYVLGVDHSTFWLIPLFGVGDVMIILLLARSSG